MRLGDGNTAVMCPWPPSASMRELATGVLVRWVMTDPQPATIASEALSDFITPAHLLTAPLCLSSSLEILPWAKRLRISPTAASDDSPELSIWDANWVNPPGMARGGRTRTAMRYNQQNLKSYLPELKNVCSQTHFY